MISQKVKWMGSQGLMLALGRIVEIMAEVYGVLVGVGGASLTWPN